MPGRWRTRPVEAARHGAARGVTVWRRSIQARVVISTLLLSALVVALVGWVLLRQVTNGLVEEKTRSSVAESSRATAEAQRRLSAANGNDFDAGTQLTQLVSTLVSRGAVQGYEIVLRGPIAGSNPALPAGAGTTSTPGVLRSSIPDGMRRAVESGTGDEASYSYTTIRYAANADRPPVPGVVTGSQVTLPADGGTYTLYYLFPMSEQERTVSLVRRALVTGGALLLLLVGGLTWLVTRQVVTPVRLARRTAERLASGRLEERMQVSGDDDIARLGTSFNQMAASLQQQIRQLEELSRVQRRFVSDVSHELRTPLTTVRMAGDVLHDARDRFDPPTARAAELLQKELDRFELLLSDLLEISRFDAGAAVLDLEDVSVVDLVRRVVDSSRPLADRRGIRVVVRAAQQPCIAEVDARRVERIVRNLVQNAIDYAGSDDVEVLVASNETATALAVRDHGVGLGPGEAAMVFNRFWRADPARARTSGGTGLGLSISLEDAHLHGGWLQAWGEAGLGAQFRLTLPRFAGDPVGTSPLPLVPADATGPGSPDAARLAPSAPSPPSAPSAPSAPSPPSAPSRAARSS